MFQPTQRYFEKIGNTDHVLEWKSKGLSDESIKVPATSDDILNHSLNYVGTKLRVEFKESCLKSDKISFNHGKIINIYIVYKINKSFNISSYPTLKNCLFGAVKLTKNVDIDQYKYFRSGNGFDTK